MSVRYYLQVYGCQMNLYEADLVRAILNQAGYEETDNEFDSEVLLMMTCSVRAHAENRALGRLAQFVGLKKKGQAQVVGVLGCMAQNLKEKLVEKHQADIVVGPDRYQLLPEFIVSCLRGDGPKIAVDFSNECYENILPEKKVGVTAFVTIMRGCSNFCSYCIVPYVKGPERSRPVESILKEVHHLAKMGVKEITLLGQNVLAYNHRGVDFCALLEKVCAFSEIRRVRFLTSHPRDLDERLVRTMASLPKVCPQLHLPLQSGANRILNLMNRGYTVEEYLSKVALVRKYLPEVSLTTDIIVAFPTETEEEFEATLTCLEGVRFDYAYMFRFSPRPGTRAAEIKPLVPLPVASERLSRLIATQNRITKELSSAMVGREYELLIEGKSPKGNGALGRTPQGKVVIVDQEVNNGNLIRVKITAISGWTPVGIPVDNPAFVGAPCSLKINPVLQRGG
ncbi:MAG: tRNA (N6-isopentenyl adenosine(37)-C2)-methylthiotransferase MiaB [candidate division WOR-3 bacterium]